jgi:hypothetical protein
MHHRPSHDGAVEGGGGGNALQAELSRVKAPADLLPDHGGHAVGFARKSARSHIARSG